jgi:hypothetical protein
MDDENKKHKLTFKNIVFLSIFGLLIIVLKYYFTRSDACRDNCININSELDVIRCLDACAINSEEFLEPVSYTKIILYSFIFIIFVIVLLRFINIYNSRNIKNNIIEFIRWIKQLKENIFSREKNDDFRYKKFE